MTPIIVAPFLRRRCAFKRLDAWIEVDSGQNGENAVGHCGRRGCDCWRIGNIRFRRYAPLSRKFETARCT
jgi:hypothetical protein